MHSTSTHYARAAGRRAAGGYRFAQFDQLPSAATFSPPRRRPVARRSVALAELEAEAEVSATYFLMTESIFYNLASPRARPHSRGSRARSPRGPPRRLSERLLDERFDPVVAWHNPEPEYMAAPISGAVNACRSGTSTRPPTAPTRTSAGDTAARARNCAPAFPWLQLLDPPRDLGVRGGDHGSHDAHDARRGERAPRRARRSPAGRGRARRFPARRTRRRAP